MQISSRMETELKRKRDLRKKFQDNTNMMKLSQQSSHSTASAVTIFCAHYSIHTLVMAIKPSFSSLVQGKEAVHLLCLANNS